MLFALLFVAALALGPVAIDVVGMYFAGKNWPMD